MNRLCNSKRDCPEDASPSTDFSSEAADTEIFFATQTQNFMPPPLGSNFITSNCFSIAQGQTQEEASGQALSDVVDCIAAHGAVPPTQIIPDPPGTPPENRDHNVFINAAQICTSLCPDGLPFTFVVAPGRFTAFSQREADDMARSYACDRVVAARICISNINVPEICLNSSALIVVQASGPGTFSVQSGALPPGTTLAQSAANSAVITGSPTAIGSYQFTIRVTDSNGDYMNKLFQIRVVGITTTSLPGARALIPYSATISGSGNTIGTPIWSIVSGSLPPGLSFDTSTLIISGTPSTGGDYAFTVQMNDGIVNCQQAFTLSVAPCIPFAPSTAAHWYDASTISGSDGDQVTTISDLTSAKNDWLVIGGAGNPPILKTALKNGLNVIRWTTTPNNAKRMSLRKAITDPPVGDYMFLLNGLSQVYLFAAVANNDTGAQHSIVLSGSNSLNISNEVRFYIRGSNVAQGYGIQYSRRGEAMYVANSNIVSTIGQWNIIMWLVDFANAQMRIDVDATTVLSAAGADPGVSLQNAISWLPQDTSGEQRDLGELIFDFNALTQTQIDKYFGYLAWKWGLQGNLPANHPYKNAVPCS